MDYNGNTKWGISEEMHQTCKMVIGKDGKCYAMVPMEYFVVIQKYYHDNNGTKTDSKEDNNNLTENKVGSAVSTECGNLTDSRETVIKSGKTIVESRETVIKSGKTTVESDAAVVESTSKLMNSRETDESIPMNSTRSVKLSETTGGKYSDLFKKSTGVRKDTVTSNSVSSKVTNKIKKDNEKRESQLGEKSLEYKKPDTGIYIITTSKSFFEITELLKKYEGELYFIKRCIEYRKQPNPDNRMNFKINPTGNFFVVIDKIKYNLIWDDVSRGTIPNDKFNIEKFILDDNVHCKRDIMLSSTALEIFLPVQLLMSDSSVKVKLNGLVNDFHRAGLISNKGKIELIHDNAHENPKRSVIIQFPQNIEPDELRLMKILLNGCYWNPYEKYMILVNYCKKYQRNYRSSSEFEVTKSVRDTRIETVIVEKQSENLISDVPDIVNNEDKDGAGNDSKNNEEESKDDKDNKIEYKYDRNLRWADE